jgi:hypothetical protein
VRRPLLVLALLALAWGAIVLATGGIDWRLAGVLIRSRDPFRAFAVGLILLLIHTFVSRQAAIAGLERAMHVMRRLTPAFAALAAVALGTHAIVFGTFVASGADSYGYVSQAYAWRSGQLPAASPVPVTLPFPSSDAIQAPLGYSAGPQPHTIVPTYAPGLPLMMAAALLIGSCGPYLVVPLFSALFVWLTFLLGRRAGGPIAGLIAALILLVSPVVLYQAVWPMTDIPAGALWTGAALASLSANRRGATLAGVCTAAGLLVRPNLPLLVLVPFAFVATGASGRERWLRLVTFCAPAALVAIFVGALNARWYGAPWRSGYGDTADLYSLSSLIPNLQRYPVWLWESQTPAVLLGCLPLLPLARTGLARRPVWLAAAMFLAALSSYILYFPFDVWWYLRFLLPGFGGLAVLMSCGIVIVGRRVPSPFGAIVAAVILIFVGVQTIRFARDKGVFGLIDGEHRYVDVAEFVSEKLPVNAVVFAMQHSGTVRFYGGRYTLRYDFIDPGWTDRAAPALEQLGYHPYLLIDDWEAPLVRKQFHFAADTPLPWVLFAGYRAYGGVTLYDMASNAAGGAVFAVEPGASSRCGAPRRAELHAR